MLGKYGPLLIFLIATRSSVNNGDNFIWLKEKGEKMFSFCERGVGHYYCFLFAYFDAWLSSAETRCSHIAWLEQVHR